MVDIKSISEEAKILVSDKDVEYIEEKLKKTVEQLSEFSNLDLEYIKDREYVNTFRKDEVKPSLSTDEVFQNTEHKKYSYFEVGLTVEEEGF